MTTVRNLACLSVFLLAACGADPAPGPVEQIIVRDPGAAPAVAVAAAETNADAPASALLADGKAAFASCSACHSLEQGAPNGAGPNLFGIIGSAAGKVAGFSYSDAMKTSGVTWTAAELESFIADPAAKIPGTTMVAGAIADPAKRQAVIAYLESATAN
ncbi:c-type cytochrome [uncultured Parasphingorhabdus sp.]|uniref:c-type cytochrome n=1 Tax=uncultured Parasphingorhabdus sp. TaxID=2709694 RepID=UPI0030DAD4A0|tara:strand:+ start:9754 stop:10230 length:477 start_codon:yes stop_codon:yes gene_type:complete